VWDQTFCFMVKSAALDFVQVSVWDKNVGTNQMIGQGRYLLQNLTMGIEEIVQLPILKGKKTTGVIEMGLKAVGFGKQPPQIIHTHTTSTTTYAPPPPTMIAMQPAPMPTYTNVQQTYTQPVMAPQYTQTTVDNNMYAAYSGMLYGTNTPTAPVMVPEGQPMMVPTGQPMMVSEGQPMMVSEGQPMMVPSGQPMMVPEGQPMMVPEGQPMYFPPANEVYPGYPVNQGVPMGGTVDNNVQYYNPNVFIQQ